LETTRHFIETIRFQIQKYRKEFKYFKKRINTLILMEMKKLSTSIFCGFAKIKGNNETNNDLSSLIYRKIAFYF